MFAYFFCYYSNFSESSLFHFFCVLCIFSLIPLYFSLRVAWVSIFHLSEYFPFEWVFSIWVSIFHFSRCFYVCSVCFCLNTLNFSCVLPIFLDLVIIILVRGVNEYFLSLLIFTNMFCFCSIFPHSTLFLLTRGVSEYSLSFLTFTHFFCICSTFSEASLFCLRLF